jgi:predicted dehydrogenase
MDKLKTAVLGLNEDGLALLKAAGSLEYYEIVAVADKDTSLAETIALEYKCTPFDDYRQLIIQNQLDCLIVAAGLHTCDEYVRMAMKKKVNILKVPPPARNFEELVEFYRLAEAENVKFAIANSFRFTKSFQEFKDYWQNQTSENIYLILVSCIFWQTNQPLWYSDPVLAGGGVLLRNSYFIIDLLIDTFNLPEQVYSLNTNMAADKKQRQYLTEDIAVATMKFSETTFCNITAARNAPFSKPEQSITVYTKDKIISVNQENFSIKDCFGKTLSQSHRDNSISNCSSKMLENFAQNILSPQEDTFFGSAKNNLQNMALIEAAYVSARTGLPEKPGKILALTSLNFKDL